MAQIKQLKDTTGNFYPVTHKDAIVGIEDIQVDMTGYATELWVENKGYLTEHLDISGKVDVADFEEATLVTSAAMNALNLNKADKEDTYTKEQVEELLKDVDVDLTNYYTKQEVDNKFGSITITTIGAQGKKTIALATKAQGGEPATMKDNTLTIPDATLQGNTLMLGNARLEGNTLYL